MWGLRSGVHIPSRLGILIYKDSGTIQGDNICDSRISVTQITLKTSELEYTLLVGEPIARRAILINAWCDTVCIFGLNRVIPNTLIGFSSTLRWDPKYLFLLWFQG